MQVELDQKKVGSRTWKLANLCIFGTDKNDRMARTSKMNMIMHGDGHGGIHHWNGFLNVNGIFESRFDCILTNPPFGSKLESDEKILADDIYLPEEVEEHYERMYKDPYRKARSALKAAVNQPIATLFNLPTADSSIKTELLFIERCLSLLTPGGRLGIVLPESVFNNPSIAYVRRFVEDRARILAVVSLPADTFVASGATVKTSLLFLRKFNKQEQAQYDKWTMQTHAEALTCRKVEIDELEAVMRTLAAKQRDFLAHVKKPTAEQKAAASTQARDTNEALREAEIVDIPFLGALAGCSARRSERRVASHTSEEQRRNAPARAAKNGILAFSASLKEKKKVTARMLKAIESEVEADARRRLRKKATYPLFMYEADRVGITATGASDDNELFPNPRVPTATSETALELYRRFSKNPKPFLDAPLAEGKAT